jgi:hypothetical protein
VTSAPLYVFSEADYDSRSILRLILARPSGVTVSTLRRGDFPAGPIVARRHMGSVRQDFTDAGDCVVTSSFRDSVLRHGLSGAVFAPLTVDDDAEQWWLMGISGSCGPFDYTQSLPFDRVIRLPNGGETHQAWLRGFVIDGEGAHSGDDFVLPPTVNTAVVTQRVVDALTTDAVTNVRFTAIEKFEIPASYVQGAKRGSS